MNPDKDNIHIQTGGDQAVEKETIKRTFFSGGEWPYLLILGVIMILTALCRLRSLGVPFERDEGEYAYAAQEMLKGIPPFQSVHHVKLPGVYAMYALFISLFGHSVKAVHLGLIFCNLTCIAFCYVIARRLFNSLSAVFAAFVYAVFTLSDATYGFTANTEHFVLLFTLPAILLLLIATDDLAHRQFKKTALSLFFSGLLLGLAYTMKQHALYFIVFAVAFYIYSSVRSGIIFKGRFLSYGIVLAIGICIPLLILCLIFARLHLFDTFWFWTFYYPRAYVSQIPLKIASLTFRSSFRPIIKDNWPVLLLSAAGFAVTAFQKESKHKFFLLIFAAASAFMVAAGFYFFKHYFLNAAPALAFFAAAAIYWLNEVWLKIGNTTLRTVGPIILLPLMILLLVYINRYYYFSDDDYTISRKVYGNNIFPESPAIGAYLDQHTLPTDKIAILGSEPQIYFYANRSAATGFIYTYEMMKIHPYVVQFQNQMIQEIEVAKPKYILAVNLKASWFATFVKDPDMRIVKWSNKYTADYYEPVGMVEVLYPYAASDIEFDRPDKTYQHQTDSYVVLYKRKE